jgi:hypothetical protein
VIITSALIEDKLLLIGSYKKAEVTFDKVIRLLISIENGFFACVGGCLSYPTACSDAKIRIIFFIYITLELKY